MNPAWQRGHIHDSTGASFKMWQQVLQWLALAGAIRAVQGPALCRAFNLRAAFFVSSDLDARESRCRGDPEAFASTEQTQKH
jgi:hypothetical protein